MEMMEVRKGIWWNQLAPGQKPSWEEAHAYCQLATSYPIKAHWKEKCLAQVLSWSERST